MNSLLPFLGGLAVLVAGAEALVRGASRLALRLGLSPLLIGLTVVAFGTSAPELAVSVQSALAGAAGMAVGNVVGSNIFNVLVVLGASALITPLVVQQQLVRVDVPLLCVVSAVFWVMTAARWPRRCSSAIVRWPSLGCALLQRWYMRTPRSQARTRAARSAMKSWYSTGVSVFQTPCGPRKSGIPLSVLMPAPVKATPRRALRTTSQNAVSFVIPPWRFQRHPS